MLLVIWERYGPMQLAGCDDVSSEKANAESTLQGVC